MTHSVNTVLSKNTDPIHREQEGHFFSFMGQSEVMISLYKTIRTVAGSRAPVFIRGETGTGKELAADAIHRCSPRWDQPFVPINCASIPRDLMESELFGHAKGAFTGAHAERDGSFIQADKGTLFLDEIAEMDMAIQAKLLRFLQTGEVRRVGESRLRTVDVRVISATHRDLLDVVRQGRFRQDLFYRLHVAPLEIPPLRSRGEDVLLIADHMLKKYAHEDGRNFSAFSPESQALLQNYPWAGNVRELINTIRAVVALHDGDVVHVEMLRATLDAHRAKTDPDGLIQALDISWGATLASESSLPSLASIEREAISSALNSFGGNVKRAAKALGINPSTVHRKLAAYSAVSGPDSQRKNTQDEARS